MDVNTYSDLAMRTAGNKNPLMNGLLGLAGETGEVVDYMKKVLFHDKEFDRNVLVKEIGDCAWYLNLILVTMDITWEEVLEANIKKLEARYPDLRFNVDHANNRNTEAEDSAVREALK